MEKCYPLIEVSYPLIEAGYPLIGITFSNRKALCADKQSVSAN
ncbi:hypothetical protein [Neobacillus sp. 19]